MRIFVLLLACRVFAHNIQDHINATLANEPSTVVEGCVNAITGAYLIQETDIDLHGRGAFQLNRSYLSSEQDGYVPQWELLPHLRLKQDSVSYLHGDPNYFWEVKEPNGVVVRYNRKDGKPILGKGFCHVGGQSIANNAIHASHLSRDILLYAADGSTRRYRRGHVREHALLVEEIRPNGIVVIYEYEKSVNPRRIKVLSPTREKVYLSLLIKYVRWGGEQQQMVIYKEKPRSPRSRGDDGEWLATYHYASREKKGKIKLQLARIETRDYPVDAVGYSKLLSHSHYANESSYLVTERKSGERPACSLTYFCRNTPEGKRDFSGICRGKVASLSIPYSLSESGVYQFAYEEKRTTVTDPLGNRTIYGYDSDKRLTKVLRYRNDLLYYHQEYRWSKEGDLEEKILFNKGRPYLSLAYTYDAHHNCLTETVRGDLTGSGASISRTTSYTYVKQGHFFLPASKTLSSGVKTVYTYHKETNLPKTVDTYVGDELQVSEVFSYDRENILIEHVKKAKGIHLCQKITPKLSKPGLHQPASVATYTQGKLLGRIDYAYNCDNLVTEAVHFDATGSHLYTLHKRYDQKGRLVEESDPLGRVTKTTYDSHNNPIRVDAGNCAYSVKTKYDFQYRPIQTMQDERVEETRYDLLSRPIVQIDHRGHKTHTVYANNALKTTVTKAGVKTVTETDFLGRPISVADPDGNITTYTYNAFGQETSVTYADGSSESKRYTADGFLKQHTLANGATIHYSYDPVGRVTKKRIANSITTYTYGPLHLLSETDPLGTETTYTYDSAGRKIATKTGKHRVKYVYDAASRLTKTITYTKDNEARVDIELFDLAGRVKERRSEDLMGIVYASTSYTYDAYDNCLTETTGERTTHYAYDKWGRKIATIDALGQKTTMSYRESSTLQTVTTDPKGRTFTTIYDPLERPVQTEAHLGTKLLAKHRYSYTPGGDKTDAFITVASPTGLYTHHHHWNYTSRHQVVSLTQSDLQTTRYTYTPTGQIATRTNPDGTTLSYTYDSFDNNTRLATSDGNIDYSYVYDRCSRLTNAIDNKTGRETTRVYDQYGNITSETLANGLVRRRTFDNISRPTALIYPDKTKTTYTYNPYQLTDVHRGDYTHTYTYNAYGEVISSGDTTSTYDALGRRHAIASSHHADTIEKYDATSNPVQRTLNNTPYLYTYDDYDHLISEPSHTYAYDSLHNRHKTDTTLHTVNSLNQDTSHTYDLNGNPVSSKEHTYTYDALNRLTSVDDKSLIYDALNRLVMIDGDAILYDHDLDIGTYRNGEPLNLRILGNTPNAEIGAAILVELDRSYIPHHDLFGNVILLDQSYTYTAYGTTHASSNPWQYRSKRTIGHLIYFTNRFYDPTLGRFLTPDPLGYTDTYNLYHYALSSPLSYNDPWGLYSREEWNQDKQFGIGNFLPKNNIRVPYKLSSAESSFSSEESSFSLHRPEMIETNRSFTDSLFYGIKHGLIDHAFSEYQGQYDGWVRLGLYQMETFDTFEREAILAYQYNEYQKQQMALNRYYEKDFHPSDSDRAYYLTKRHTGTAIDVAMFVLPAAHVFKVTRTTQRINRSVRRVSGFSRGVVRSYLSESHKLSKNSIVRDLQSSGFRISGRSPDGNFLQFHDRFGNLRAKIHPPDVKTPYNHIHIYNKSGQSLDKTLKVVDKRSRGAHIPFQGK